MKPGARGSRSGFIAIAALMAILALGAFLRFFLLAELPPGLYGDEAMNGNNAVEALRTGQFRVFYPENNGREGLFINIQALAIRFFGPDPSSLRGVSAAIGTLTVVAVWALSRELFFARTLVASPALASLLASFFLATSYWHMNFSRIGFRAICVPLLSSLAAFWLFRAYRTGRMSSAVLGGITTGIGLSTYTAFRFVPFALAVPMATNLRQWLHARTRDRSIPCTTALFVVAAAVAFAPLAVYFAQHPGNFFSRSEQLSIFSAESPIYEFLKSNALTLGMFNVRGDCNARHNLECQPELYWPVGILLFLGVVRVLRRALTRPFGSEHAGIFLVAWFIFLMFPATLTRQGLPHALRAIGLIPPAMLFAAVGGCTLWEWLSRWFARADARSASAPSAPHSGFFRPAAIILAAGLLLVVPVRTYKAYFIDFAGSPDTREAFSADLWDAGLYLRTVPATTTTFVVVNMPGGDVRGIRTPAQTIMFATGTFEEAPRRQKRFHYVHTLDEISFSPNDAVTVVPMNARDPVLLDALTARFPSLVRRTAGTVVIFENVPAK